jgi:hypothetical protein
MSEYTPYKWYFGSMFYCSNSKDEVRILHRCPKCFPDEKELLEKLISEGRNQ